MKLDVVLGLQWGDEGKGKIVDVLASRYPTVARFQGGPNAGHSLHFDGKSFVCSTAQELEKAIEDKIIPNNVNTVPVVAAQTTQKLTEWKYSLNIIKKRRRILCRRFSLYLL